MSTRPTLQQWLRENPGKSLHDYFLAYPEPRTQPQIPAYNRKPTPEERRQSTITLLWFFVVIAAGAAGLWFAPRQSAPYITGGLAALLYMLLKKEEILYRLLGKSQAADFFLDAMKIAIPLLFMASLYKLLFMFDFPKTIVVLFNGSATEQSFTFDGEQKTLKSAEIWIIECRDGNHKLLNPQTNMVEKMNIQPGFHAFAYGKEQGLKVVEVAYKAWADMTMLEKMGRENPEIGFWVFRSSSQYPELVKDHFVVLHEMHNHVYLPGQQPYQNVTEQEGTEHKYFKLEISGK
ncbi:MAG: hypothetical protein ACKV1O_04140 [Saprospiraceae bacterium]